MEEYLPFVSIDLWTMIFTWVNLGILFLLLKKFLFGPVNKVLDERSAEIENSYKKAEEIKSEAQSMKAEYESRISGAKTEADVIIKSAVEAADKRSGSILSEANEQAKHIMEKSRKQIEAEKRNAMEDAESAIASMAVEIAEKIIGEKLDPHNDEKLILDIIDRI